MGFRIRKSIKVAPGVRLNFGKNGISTSIGKRGAGITIGPTGATAHVGIPGTGISYVKKVGTTNTSVKEKQEPTDNGENTKGKFSCLGCFLAFFVIVIVMVLHSTYEWTALTLSILVICVLYIAFAFKVYLNKTLHFTRDTNHTKDVPQDLGTTATPINPKEPFTRYKYPPLNLLRKYEDNYKFIDEDEQRANKNRIIEILGNFGIQIKTIHATVDPAITLYEMQLADGMLLSKVKELEDDIALSLSSFGTRVIVPIPGKETFGIEIPNSHPDVVSIESVLNSPQFNETRMELPLALGKAIAGDVYMVDLSMMPHLLIAGSDEQNGSLGLDAIIFSLIYKKHPNELKLVLIDLHKVELNVYSRIANKFMAAVPDEEPVVTDTKKAMLTLNSLCQVMNDRNKLFEKVGVCNIKEYNQMYINHRLRLVDGHEYLPYIVVIINEFSDLIMTYGKEAEDLIVSLAKEASAVGIHMVITTHRPTKSIVTDVIKDNISGRIAFRMTLKCDSQIILGCPDATRLVGRGDMFCMKNKELVRVQCAFVEVTEIERVCEFISQQPGPMDPLELPEPLIERNDGLSNATMVENKQDPFFEEAAYAIVISQNGSTSMIQRRFSIGYNRASRLMDQLEAAGIVGEALGSKPREIYVQSIGELKLKLAKRTKHSHSTIHQTAPANGLLSDKERTSESPRIKTDLQKNGFDNKSQGKEALSVSNPLDALKSLIGLASVKEEVASLVNFIRLNKKRAELGASSNSNCISQCVYWKSWYGQNYCGKIVS